MRRLVHWYDQRIVNVNINIILAGALALGITVVVMHALVSLGLENNYAITALTFLVDLVADVGVYFALHWAANHMPRSAPRVVNVAYGRLGFLKDATLVQFERAVLSPVLYIIALGLQHTLLRLDWGVAAATSVGFAVGIACSRSLHTLWMLRQERAARARAAARPAPAQDAPALRKGA